MCYILKKRNAYSVFCRGNVNERDHVEDLGIDGKIVQ
jgi:hypothetical protein